MICGSDEKSKLEVRRQRGAKGQHCDGEVDKTYELSAWYEPLLMIDLIMKMKIESFS